MLTRLLKLEEVENDSLFLWGSRQTGKSTLLKALFLKAWNEWGEGNYVEPDQKFGHGYIQAIRKAIYGVRPKNA